jgi:hypothetical protein
MPFFVFFIKKKLHFLCKKTRKKNCFVIFFGVEGCAVDHPRITIIKEEEEEENVHYFQGIQNLHKKCLFDPKPNFQKKDMKKQRNVCWFRIR